MILPQFHRLTIVNASEEHDMACFKDYARRDLGFSSHPETLEYKANQGI